MLHRGTRHLYAESCHLIALQRSCSTWTPGNPPSEEHTGPSATCQEPCPGNSLSSESKGVQIAEFLNDKIHLLKPLVWDAEPFPGNTVITKKKKKYLVRKGTLRTLTELLSAPGNQTRSIPPGPSPSVLPELTQPNRDIRH